MRNNLYTLLKADEKQVRKIIIKTLKKNGYNPVVRKDFIYAEGTVPVMLLAHYDTFAESPRYIVREGNILSGRKNGKPHQLGADDRAGVYAVLETIVKHHCHVLFTGGEERGGIGASAFVASGIEPDVNYCLQFDRRGENDAVYYDSANDEFEKFIESHGWEAAFGTFTDICTVCPYLGVMGVNLSIGFENEHTTKETLDTDIMNNTIKRIPELLNEEQKFEYGENLRYFSDYYGSYFGGGWYDFYDREYSEHNRYSEPKEKDWYIYYEDTEGDTDWVIVSDETFQGAIGMFVIQNPDIPYKNIKRVFSEDAYINYLEELDRAERQLM